MEYKAVQLELEEFDLNFPVIVSAYKVNEENSVPIDRIELKHKFDNKNLVLKKGEYRISVFDGKNTFDVIEKVH